MVSVILVIFSSRGISGTGGAQTCVIYVISVGSKIDILAAGRRFKLISVSLVQITAD